MEEVRLVVEGRGNWVYAHGIPAGEPAVIGRSHEAGIVLNDPHASSRHAEIVRSGKDYILRDLGSRNGTLLNGSPVKEAKLAPGDEIKIGVTRIFFEADDDDVTASRPLGGGEALTLPPAETGRRGERPAARDAASETIHVLKLSRDFNRLMAVAPDPRGRHALALRFIAEAAGADNGFLMLISPATMKWQVRARYGEILDWAPPADASEAILPLSLTAVDKAVESGVPFVTRHALDNPKSEASESIVAFNIQACVCVPVKAGGKPAGVVYLDRRNNPESFDALDERVAIALTEEYNLILLGRARPD